ncbi:HRDC domain-containing protein [Pedobacter mucosus]|uniref:HRDC domain-containing protein n=1 Tax=Pedobacter mucosus TaxID=2895286 RepID=UPI001EE4DB8D|nr:HRDC domain-containing protein [Pedobacter mucosus]UKT66159.1 HRDC domain-containing protein [Pedobacter mucosus]
MEKISKLKLYNDPSSDRLFNILTGLKDAFYTKIALFKISFNPFSVSEYIKTSHSASNLKPVIQETKLLSSIKPKAIANPQLYDKLSLWRKDVANKRGVQDYAVLSDQSLLFIAEKLPRTTDQLAAIKSVGIGNAREHGQQITGIVNAHLGTSTLF